MRMLTVQIDGALAQLGEVRHGGQTAVDVRTGPAIGRDHTGHHVLVVTDHEPAFDARLRGTGAHHGGVGTSAHQEADGFDEHRLPGAGLAGERREAVPEHQVEAVDHPE